MAHPRIHGHMNQQLESVGVFSKQKYVDLGEDVSAEVLKELGGENGGSHDQNALYAHVKFSKNKSVFKVHRSTLQPMPVLVQTQMEA